MFITALWVLEQEYKALKWIWDKGGMSRPGGSFQETPMTDFELVLASGALVYGGAQTGAIASLGYSGIARVGGQVDDFVRLTALNEPTGFRLTSKGYVPKFAKHSARKMFMAKAAARFVPYLGWGLLAVDLFMVGKWIGEKTS